MFVPEEYVITSHSLLIPTWPIFQPKERELVRSREGRGLVLLSVEKIDKSRSENLSLFIDVLPRFDNGTRG